MKPQHDLDAQKLSPAALAVALSRGLNAEDVARVLDNLRAVNRIDPSASVDPSATVWHYSVVLQDVVIGERVNIGSHCEVGRGSTIGAETRIGSFTFLPPHSKVGQRVFIGPHCMFCDDMHPYVHGPSDAPYEAKPPVIGDGANIGAGCVILPGVTIGTGATIGAGSVVTRDVAPFAHVRGEPARVRSLGASSITWSTHHAEEFGNG